MLNNNSYGLSLLIATLALVCCTLLWNYLVSSKYRITFDKAEKIAIYLLALFLVMVAIYITFF